MIKNVKWIFVVLIISSLISFSFVGKNTPTEGLTIGDKAPIIYYLWRKAVD